MSQIAASTTPARARRRASNVPMVFLAGYGLALAGTAWDDLVHEGVLGLPGLAHLTIYLGFAVLLFGLVRFLGNRQEMFGPEARAHPLASRAMVAGTAIVLAGIVVDFVWHGANPDGSESMLLSPGHAVQHVGIVIGLAGSFVALIRDGAVGGPTTRRTSR